MGHRVANESRQDAEDGVSLIEVIVALAILAILLTGLSATLMNTLDLSRNNANRIVASNLAASAISELSTRPFGQLEEMVGEPTSAATWTEVVDGREFEMTRRVYWSSNLADPGPCLGTIGKADENILRVTVEARWQRSLTGVPVISETAVSPPNVETSSESGTIAVFIGDHQAPPEGVSNVEVTLTGPLPTTATQQQMSTVDGCAVFQGLTRGDYEVSIAKSGYIDLDQRKSPEVVNQIGTAPRIWANIEFRYAKAGEVTIEPRGWHEAAALPLEEFGWFAENNRDGSPYWFDESTGDWELFPGLYDFGVECPRTEGGIFADDAGEVASGQSQQIEVTLGAFEVTWSQQVLDALEEEEVTPRPVTLRAHPPPLECYDGISYTFPSFMEGEEGRTFALPFGDGWTIEAEVGGEVINGGPVNLDPEDAPTLPNVEFDYFIPIGWGGAGGGG